MERHTQDENRYIPKDQFDKQRGVVNMPSNFFALLIGFNEYKDKESFSDLHFAEKDANDFYKILTDIEIGGYPTKNIELLIGKDVKTEEIEQKLYYHVVKDRKPDDIIVVFFSGHGYIAGEEQKAYLATPDVSIMDVLRNPREGLQMEFIHNDIFMGSKARYVILFLDCCHSGAFIPGFKKERDANGGRSGAPHIEKGLIKDIYFTGEGRVAFVSSPKGVSSRENKDLKNGIFTYHLLNGLKGMAVEPYTGEVTLNSLIPYVQALTPASQPPVRYGKDTGRIVLTRPSQITLNQFGYIGKVRDVDKLSQRVPSVIGIDFALDNPIKNEFIYIEKLLQCLKNSVENDQPVSNKILSAIQQSLDSDLVFIQHIDPEHGIINKAFSKFSLKTSLGAYINATQTTVLGFVSQEKRELLPKRFGVFIPQSNGSKSSNKNIIIIPLRLDTPKEFMIITGVDNEKLYFGEIIGHALASVYQSTDNLNSLDLLRIETTILDNLKTSYGLLPYDVFMRRYQAYLEKLQTIIFYFEPIINLGRDIEIDSWEALARDPTTENAPVDLFKAAELWGSKFIKALDLYCIQNAVTTYVSTWRKEHGKRKIDPLSVNIYPETVYFDDYVNELERIVKKEELIKGAHIIFELSERRPIPKPFDKVHMNKDETEDFSNRLNDISSRLNVGFAIDDFGVGYSSISKLARLELAHVKIDKEILHHEHPETTIKYVLDLVHKAHSHSIKIVVEGFDGDSRITLPVLYHNLNIEYIQGHLLRRASQSLNDLLPSKVKFIKKLLAEKPVL